jgi:hypothetical protein
MLSIPILGFRSVRPNNELPTVGYYGTLYYAFYPSVRTQYIISMKMGRVSSTATSYDYYSLYSKISDTGYPSFPYLWFAIFPGDYSENWEVLCYLSGVSNPGWYLLASDSKSYSPSIKMEQN